MNDYANLDTSIEIMAYKIANCVNKSNGDESSNEELKKLCEERDEMYNGNLEIIDKIINEYGKELKKLYNK